MTITKFVSYDEVRFELGPSSKELKDTTLALPMFYAELLFAFEEVSKGIVPLYDSIMLIAEDSRTAAQTMFLSAVRTFAVYTVAKMASVSLGMYALKSITDGKAEQQRFDHVDSTIERLEANLVKATARLAVYYVDAGGTEPVPVSTVFNHMRVSSLTVDPVTNI